MGLLRIKPCWRVPYPGIQESISFVDALQLGHRRRQVRLKPELETCTRYYSQPTDQWVLQVYLKKWRNDISLQHGISPLKNTHKYNNHRDNCEVLLGSTILEAATYSKQWKVKNLDSWLAIKPGSPKKTCEFLKLLSVQPFVFCAMFNRSRIPELLRHCAAFLQAPQPWAVLQSAAGCTEAGPRQVFAVQSFTCSQRSNCSMILGTDMEKVKVSGTKALGKDLPLNIFNIIW